MKALKKILILFVAITIWHGAFAFADDSDIWKLPGKSTVLTDITKPVHVEKVAQITGENSDNKTLSRFGVWGTDLGSMTELNGKVYLFGGDTFSSAKNDGWRSNVLFIIEDDQPADGLTITGAITDKKGEAKEILGSAKRDNVQMTVIPTDILTVGNDLYCVYMSVKHWNEKGGSWVCGFSGLAKSSDEGKTWKKLEWHWPGDSNFIQTAHCQIGDEIYFWGIPSGRFGGVSLMKVKAEEIENEAAYLYLTGTDESKNPIWTKGPDGIKQAITIIDAPVGEISVLYNEYLGNFVMTYLHEEGTGIVMREGVTPWGEWGEEYVLATPQQYASLYGAYLCPKYVENKGKTFYFAMSQYFPVYNIMWMKATIQD